nr:MAG TPA: hypothetical protein [Caudoviricetes sp.]
MSRRFVIKCLKLQKSADNQLITCIFRFFFVPLQTIRIRIACLCVFA